MNLLRSENYDQYKANLLSLSGALARRVVGVSIFNSRNYFEDKTWRKAISSYSQEGLRLKHRLLSPISLPKLFSVEIGITHTGYIGLVGRYDCKLESVVVVSVERFRHSDWNSIPKDGMESFHPFLQQQRMIVPKGSMEDGTTKIDGRIITYEEEDSE